MDHGLTIGVTGHRLNRVPQCQLDRLTPQMQWLLAQIAHAAPNVGATLLSGLAEGSDRHLAQLALAQGFALHAVLPFPREVYLRDFATAASRRQFHRLLTQSRQVTELPGKRGANGLAYRLAGQALVARIQLLIAVWDGRPPQGAGGTGEVVAAACRNHVPVIHLPVNLAVRPQLNWQRFGQCSATLSAHSRPCSASLLATVIARALARRPRHVP